MDKPHNSQNTKIEVLRVKMELESLRVEFQVDATWKKAKSKHGKSSQATVSFR